MIKIIFVEGCPSCDLIKNIVKQNNLKDIEFLEFPDNPEAKELVNKLGIASVPRAVINGKVYTIEVDNTRRKLVFKRAN